MAFSPFTCPTAREAPKADLVCFRFSADSDFKYNADSDSDSDRTYPFLLVAAVSVIPSEVVVVPRPEDCPRADGPVSEREGRQGESGGAIVSFGHDP